MIGRGRLAALSVRLLLETQDVAFISDGNWPWVARAKGMKGKLRKEAGVKAAKSLQGHSAARKSLNWEQCFGKFWRQ